MYLGIVKDSNWVFEGCEFTQSPIIIVQLGTPWSWTGRLRTIWQVLRGRKPELCGNITIRECTFGVPEKFDPQSFITVLPDYPAG